MIEATADILEARLIQARAVVLAVKNTWDRGNFKLVPERLYEAIWTTGELLDQGLEAMRSIEEEDDLQTDANASRTRRRHLGSLSQR